MISRIVVIILIGLFAFFVYKDQGFDVRAGQVWVKEYNTENPFEEPYRDTLYVLEVRGLYAQYNRFGQTMSDRSYWVKVNARRIK